MGNIQMEFCAEIRGKIEKEEPPDGIGDELARGKCPGLTMTEQFAPGYEWTHLLGSFLVDMPQFGAGERGVVAGLAIFSVPENDPRRTEEACDQESRVPAVVDGDPGNDDGRQNRA